MKKDNSMHNHYTRASSAVAMAIFALLSFVQIFLLIGSEIIPIAHNAGFGPLFGVLTVLTAMVTLLLFFGVNLYLRLYKKDVSEPRFALTLAAEITCGVLTLASAGACVLSAFYARGAYLDVLPYFVVAAGAVAFVFLLPLTQKATYASMVAVIVAVALAGSASLISGGSQGFSYDSAPAVFDNGHDFSVVWSTSAPSVGYLEYTYQNVKYTVYDQSDGKYNTDSRVHTVHVPYDHLYGNTYTLYSAQVLKDTPYNPKLGNFVASPSFTFTNKVDSDAMTILAASDWHGNVRSLTRAAAAVKRFDLFIMMGDSNSTFTKFEDIIDNIVIAGGRVTNGTKPILYVRGNHEQRGAAFADIIDVLGYDKYYFSTTYGSQNFLVFDSCEDKSDDHPEYGGVMLSELYREAELDYMEMLPVRGGYTIALSHIPEYTLSTDATGRERFEDILQRHHVHLLVSGHNHALQMVNGEHHDTLIDGGPTKAYGYVLCRITIATGIATIDAIDTDGNTVQQYNTVLRSDAA